MGGGGQNTKRVGFLYFEPPPPSPPKIQFQGSRYLPGCKAATSSPTTPSNLGLKTANHVFFGIDQNYPIDPVVFLSFLEDYSSIIYVS